MKEWKKPLVKVVIIEEVEIVTESNTTVGLQTLSNSDDTPLYNDDMWKTE